VVKLINDLCAKIQQHIDSTAESISPTQQVVATQVKEKYGSLRFYYKGGNDIIDEMVDTAEFLSLNICDVCGGPAQSVSQRGWAQTRCNKHLTYPVN
jgi:hypothetical protein